jgi:hypothetical protein
MMMNGRLSRVVLIALFAATTIACGSEQDGADDNNGIVDPNNNSQVDVGPADADDDADQPDVADEDSGPSTGDVTYYEHIKPILDGRCASCHVQDGIAPFTIDTYDEAFALRASIGAAVSSRTMPPWLAGDGCTEYKHDFSLTDEQIDLIERWVELDAPEGDASNAGAPLPEVGGGLSRVDLTLGMPQSYTPQQSPDDYRCFALDWPEDSTKYVTGFGVEPGHDQTVHHVIAYLAAPGLADEIAQKEAAEDGPGYTCFGGPGVGTQDPTGGNNASWLGSWAPGGQGHDFPEGTGIPAEPGSTIILQVHYNTLTADPAPDQTEIMVKLDDNVDKEAMYLPWANPAWLQSDAAMRIPAGSTDTTHSFSYDIASFAGTDVMIYDVGFHMHTLGTKGRLWIDRDDGSEDCLLDIPRWDFNWQFGYRLDEPTRLEAGDSLGIECQWDNSAENQPIVDGERLTPRDVSWGDGTTDEMCLGLFYVTFAD